jgi:hypothetical protein
MRSCDCRLHIGNVVIAEELCSRFQSIERLPQIVLDADYSGGAFNEWAGKE